MKKETLLKLLSQGPTTVVFTKKDGTTRTMQCTRKIELIPVDQRPKNSIQEENSDNIRVYDLEKNGWRSFNFSNILQD